MSELRWASVLFVDLVSYTPLTEGWDAEDVRELLTGYFQVANTVVERYGGSVEKFIGDAVVAAWGATTSREDDSQRCVRAGLEILEAVAGYGERRQLAGLTARAGVVTGQVASWVGAKEGLVAGDRVNLAARVQSTAEPGTLLVDEVTMGATRATVAYADAGTHVLKGVAEPLQLWRAVRVVAGAVANQRADGLEAAFVGRARELTLVKELFHSTVEEGRARLVAVSGVAGVGKSRLSWEFEKYVAGLAGPVFWHRGRCLSYGDGVAFWALAEMVRQRFEIAEDDAADVVAKKLAEGLRLWVPVAEEREFVEPRLAVLVGAVDRDLSQEDLFAGWRLFIERLAALRPVVLVVEDLHWADIGLLDFVDYLLDWSAGLPIYVLTLARPELAERRPGWHADRRNSTVMRLEPLSDSAIREVLEDLVQGMSEPVKAKITANAGGIPLYAVETVRSLVDKRLVAVRDDVYYFEGEIDDLDVPASLTAVVAARIDGLPPDERELVKGLAVLGDSFTRRAVGAVSDAPDERIDESLRTLVRKELLAVRSNALSPERDQYEFVQAVVRSVAYGTLSRRERQLRHVAVADHLRSAYPHDGADVAEVIAAHLLDAYTAARNDPEAEAFRAGAEKAFERAGARAGAVGSPDAAEKHYRTAAELATNEADRTRHIGNAALMAERAGRPMDALALLDEAANTNHEASRDVEAARLDAMSGWMRLNHLSEREQTLQRLNAALLVLEREGAQEVLPELHACLASALMSEKSDRAAAAEHLERGLVLAAALEDHAALMAGLHTKAELLVLEHRTTEAAMLFSAVAELARQHDDTEMEARARGNLGRLRMLADLDEAAAPLEASRALSIRLGHVYFQADADVLIGLLHFLLGRWDDAERCLLQPEVAANADHFPLGILVRVLLLVGRGEFDNAEREVAALDELASREVPQSLVMQEVAQSATQLSRGAPELALESAGNVARESGATSGLLCLEFRLAWPLAAEAALSASRVEEAAELLGLVANAPKGHVPPYLSAQLTRFRALFAAARGEHDDVEHDLRSAADGFQTLGYRYWLAKTQVDLARWLIDQHRSDEVGPVLAEATEVFSELRAQPDLDDLHSLESSGRAQQDSTLHPAD